MPSVKEILYIRNIFVFVWFVLRPFMYLLVKTSAFLGVAP